MHRDSPNTRDKVPGHFLHTNSDALCIHTQTPNSLSGRVDPSRYTKADVPLQVHAHVFGCVHRVTQAAMPICRGAVHPFRSLAPDCQGEPRRRRWRVVLNSNRCAAEAAQRQAQSLLVCCNEIILLKSV